MAGHEGLKAAIDAAHEAVQEAHAKLYAVELELERAEGAEYLKDGLAQKKVLDADSPAADKLAGMRTEIAELRPLLVPVARWLQAAGGGTHGA